MNMLTLSNKDVGSIFRDGRGEEWEILDCDTRKDYGFIGRAKIPRIPTKKNPTTYFCIYGYFNQSGHRKHCEGFEDIHSLKEIA